MNKEPNGARRYLLIPFAPGIGDMVMMEPLLRAVLRRLPEHHVTMVAKEYLSDLYRPDGYEVVSPRYFVNETPAPLRPFHRLIPQKLIAWAAEPAMNLDLGPFDEVINLFWAWESRVPFEEWWTPQWPPRGDVRHTVDVLAGYLEETFETEIPEVARVPRLRVFPEAAAWAQQFLETLPPRRPIASLVVSAVNPLKWWTADGWAEVNDELAEAGWSRLLMAPRESAHAQEVYESCHVKPEWPEVDLRGLSALLERSNVTVGIDTGPLHIAAALGTPWIGLFGATNPDLIGPYDRYRGRAIVARFPKPPSCADCWLVFKNREVRCATLPATGCTTLISGSEVLDAIDQISIGGRVAPALLDRAR